MLKLLLSVVVCAIIFSACSRAKNDSAQVIFQLPESGALAEKVYTSSDEANSEPTSVDEMNCFYLAVGGPESHMSNIQCGKENGAGQFEAMIKAGFIFGGVVRDSATNTIEIEVPSGDKRNFYLLGMKRVNGQKCMNFANNKSFFESTDDIDGSVYIIAKSEGNNLAAGATQTISMDLNFDSSLWIQECEGSSVSQPPPNNNLPTHLALMKTVFPENAQVNEGMCQPIEFELRNSLGSPTAATGPIKVYTQVKPNLTASYTAQNTFSSLSNCSSSSGGATDFTITTGAKHAVRWIPAPSITANNNGQFYFKFYLDSTAVKPSHFDRDNSVAALFKIRASGATDLYSIAGPRLVVKNQCYGYKVEQRAASGTLISPLTASYLIQGQYRTPVALSGTAYTEKVFTAYSDDDCENEITGASSASVFYAKFHVDSGSLPVDMILKSTSNTFDGVFKQVQTVGDTTPVSLEIQGKMLAQQSSPSCKGPYYINYINSQGATIPGELISSSRTLSLADDFSGPSQDVHFKQGPACSAAFGTPGFDQDILGHELYIETSSAGQGLHPLKISDSVLESVSNMYLF